MLADFSRLFREATVAAEQVVGPGFPTRSDAAPCGGSPGQPWVVGIVH